MNVIVKCNVLFYKDFTLPLNTSGETMELKAGDVLLDVHESYRNLINENAEVFTIYDH